MSTPSLSSRALESGKLKRVALKVNGLGLLSLSFQTLGIIYSDIGTSPLYTLNAIWPAAEGAPSTEDVIGGISAVVWALTLVTLCKYVLIAMKFGTTEGEGGTFALYKSIFPPEEFIDDDRTLTGDSTDKIPSIPLSDRSKVKRLFEWPLLVWCLFATSLTLADGIFTPAVSVTSAVGGIAVARPSVTSDIIPISLALLVFVFFVQQFGTHKLSFSFAPVSFVWFLLLAGSGIYNITFYPGIFRAFDPSRAIMLFVRTQKYDLLSGVLLCLTGSEALFANLGQFNALSIQLSFATFVYPALILAYLGQGARLIVGREEVVSNIFYQSIPGPSGGGLYWIMFVWAILATVIASQAMISASFSLIQQMIGHGAFPPLRLRYTSETNQGQVYISVINWALMIAVIVVVAAFKDLAALTNAYGFAVSTVMLSTSVLLFIKMTFGRWGRWSVVVAPVFLLGFGFVDGLFWGAALKKVPHGAWVPLVIGVVLSSIVLLWCWGKGLENDFDGANRQNLRHFIYQDFKVTDKSRHSHGSDPEDNDRDDDVAVMEDRGVEYYYLPEVARTPGGPLDVITAERRLLPRIPTCAIFHKMTRGSGVPHSFVGLIRQLPALPQVMVFLSVDTLPIARVPHDQRYSVVKVRSIEGFYGVTYHIGFRDDFDVKIDDLIEELVKLEKELDPISSDTVIRGIRRVAKMSATHIVPHYHVTSQPAAPGRLAFAQNWVRKLLIEGMYRRLSTMFPQTGNWLTSADEIIYVGINAVI